MAIMAQWLTKSWVVSAKKITALTSIQTSLSLETESNDDADGEAATNIRGYQLRKLPLTAKYAIATGTADPRAEYESWEKLVGAYAPFYLAGRRFGAKNYLLSSVKATDIVMSNDGKWLEFILNLTLEEYASEASGSKSTVTGSKISKAPAISTMDKVKASYSAASVGASTADKATHKVATL